MADKVKVLGALPQQDPTPIVPSQPATYDKNTTDFQALIDQCLSSDPKDYKKAAEYEIQRNAKLAENPDLAKQYPPTHRFGTETDVAMMTNEELGTLYELRQGEAFKAGDKTAIAEANAIAERFRARHGYTAGPDGGKPVSFDPNVDYSMMIAAAEKAGDYKAAAGFEDMRNAKIDALNMEGQKLPDGTVITKTERYGLSQDREILTDEELHQVCEAREKAIADAKGGPVDWTDAHALADGFRRGHGYTAGKDGSTFEKVDYVAQPQGPSKEVSRYDQLMKAFNGNIPGVTAATGPKASGLEMQ